MSSLRRRINALEVALRAELEKDRYTGSYEHHFTEAWPACKDVAGAQRCSDPEHGPHCAFSVMAVMNNIRRVIILVGSPWAEPG